MTFADFQKLVLQRRSIRYFSDKQISKEQVQQLLDLARTAPSVQNTQPWHFHVIFDTKIREQLIDASCYGNFIDGAGVFIIVTCDNSARITASEVVWNHRELEYSCMAAMMQLILGATAMDIGSCWVSLHHGIVHEQLKLPLNHSVIGGVMLGHYKTGEEKSAEHSDRKSLDTLVTWYE